MTRNPPCWGEQMRVSPSNLGCWSHWFGSQGECVAVSVQVPCVFRGYELGRVSAFGRAS